MRHQGAGEGGRGQDRIPSPTDLGTVLVPDGSPHTVVEGGRVHLRVSPEQGLCACVEMVSRRGAFRAPPVPQPLTKGNLRLQCQEWAS